MSRLEVRLDGGSFRRKSSVAGALMYGRFAGWSRAAVDRFDCDLYKSIREPGKEQHCHGPDCSAVS